MTDKRFIKRLFLLPYIIVVTMLTACGSGSDSGSSGGNSAALPSSITGTTLDMRLALVIPGKDASPYAVQQIYPFQFGEDGSLTVSGVFIDSTAEGGTSSDSNGSSFIWRNDAHVFQLTVLSDDSIKEVNLFDATTYDPVNNPASAATSMIGQFEPVL